VDIPIRQTDYNSISGEFASHRIIGVYSVNTDREVLCENNNRFTEARFLIEGNVRIGVNFDLTLGYDTYKAKELQNEPCLYQLCKWAIAQPGATIEEVFGGAEFASWRGTIKRMAMSLFVYRPQLADDYKRKNAWTVVAQKFGGVILLSEQSKSYEDGDLETYTGFKFEQFMTVDANGQENIDCPVDSRPTFEMMVRTDLVVKELRQRKTIKLCCGGEVDALKG
ncbi:hypothetical protein PMAYCL1PPCAC_20663, partial [Pristionchus mayeri]